MSTMTSGIAAPRVFISHASEDKERFVIRFAERLRAAGVEAWLDRWEMLPGDSLVDKIFEEGIKSAAAVIVVLSSHSVEKKWVREELNAAFVKRINDGSLLIPLVIDDCEVPECLKSTLWQRIPNLNEYEDELSQVVAAVFGSRSRPPIGAPPGYANPSQATIGSLSIVDSLVLRELGKASLGSESYGGHRTEDIWERIAKTGISRRDFLEVLEVLETEGFTRSSTDISPTPNFYWLTLGGFEEFARAAVPDYAELQRAVIADIVNNRPERSTEIAERLHQKRFLVEHVMKLLHENDLIRIVEPLAPVIFITNVSPRIRRLLDG